MNNVTIVIHNKTITISKTADPLLTRRVMRALSKREGEIPKKGVAI